jgi:putative flippase GtrA
MRFGNVEAGEAPSPAASFAAPDPNRIRRLVEIVPRPLRFLAVGAIGLFTDLAVFTALTLQWPHPLLARFVSLAFATFITWRLNRALTFDRSGRLQGEEAVRYVAVSATAQGASYAVFAVLVLTVLACVPQAAVLAGAVIGAVIAYNGHRLFAFKPPLQQTF